MGFRVARKLEVYVGFPNTDFDILQFRCVGFQTSSKISCLRVLDKLASMLCVAWAVND